MPHTDEYNGGVCVENYTAVPGFQQETKTRRPMTRLRAFLPLCVAVAVLTAWASSAQAQDGDEGIAAKEAMLLDPAVSESDKIGATNYLLGAFAAGKQAALEPVKKVLQGDDSAESRQNMVPVLKVLAKAGIPAELLDLVVAKLASGDKAIRDTAFNALASSANISSRDLYARCIAIVKNPQQPEFSRISAARLIGTMGNPAAVSTLLKILREEKALKLEIRKELVRALGELKDLGVVEYLISLIDGNDKEFSRIVVDALGQITYHNYGPDRKKWAAFWRDKKKRHKPLTREKLLEDFIESLQGELAASVLEKLKAQNLDKIIEIIDYSGGTINPPSKYGKRYPKLVDVAVRQLLAIKIPDEKFPAVIAKLNQLLLYDNEEVKRTVLVNYFSSPSARQHGDSIPLLLARYQDPLEPLRMEALAALKNVVGVVVGGDPGKLDASLRKRLEDAMIAGLAGDHKTRMNAVDILGFGLRSRNALDPLAACLEFQDAPDATAEAGQFRVKICQNMHHILSANGKESLSEKKRLAFTGILGRSFLKDDYIRHVVALPLANIGYEKAFELEGAKYNGVSDLLGSRLKPGSPRKVVEGVLKALEQIKSSQSEQKVLDALKDEKVIPRNDKADNSLAVTALNTLKSVGGSASLGTMLESWTGSKITPVRTAAWEVVAACAERLLQSKHYDTLLQYRGAVGKPQEADGTPARLAQDKALDALAKADAGLKAEQASVSNLVALLDPANAEQKAKASAQIEEMAARNPSLRLTLAAGLAGKRPEAIRNEVHKLLVKLTGRKNIPNDYARWKEWLEKNP